MNIAQKVRLWFMLGTTAITAIGLLIIGVEPNVTQFNYFGTATNVTYSQGAFNAMSAGLIWAFIGFIATVVLGAICLYRFVHPLPVTASSTTPPPTSTTPSPTPPAPREGQ